MADQSKSTTTGSTSSGGATVKSPRSARRELERQASVAAADKKSFTEPPQMYPDGRDESTGLGESGFLKPGDEVSVSTRHQLRADGDERFTPANADVVDNPSINKNADSAKA